MLCSPWLNSSSPKALLTLILLLGCLHAAAVGAWRGSSLLANSFCCSTMQWCNTRPWAPLSTPRWLIGNVASSFRCLGAHVLRRRLVLTAQYCRLECSQLVGAWGGILLPSFLNCVGLKQCIDCVSEPHQNRNGRAGTRVSRSVERVAPLLRLVGIGSDSYICHLYQWITLQ